MAVSRSLQCPLCGKQAITRLRLGFAGAASRPRCRSCGQALKVPALPLLLVNLGAVLAFPAGMATAVLFVEYSHVPGALAFAAVAGGALAAMLPAIPYFYWVRLKPVDAPARLR